MDERVAGLFADWPWVVALAVSFLLGAMLAERPPARSPTRSDCPVDVPPAPRAAPVWRPTPALPPSALQLHRVERAQFEARPILNRGEQRLLDVLDNACGPLGWRVMAQVSLGEVLRSPDERAFWAVNAKRVDFLLVDRGCRPAVAVELQGSGHHLGPAATRDAVKREALRKAGVGWLEVHEGDTPTDVAVAIAKLARSRQALVAHEPE